MCSVKMTLVAPVDPELSLIPCMVYRHDYRKHQEVFIFVHVPVFV
jgi:hypothetical protein